MPPNFTLKKCFIWNEWRMNWFGIERMMGYLWFIMDTITFIVKVGPFLWEKIGCCLQGMNSSCKCYKIYVHLPHKVWCRCFLCLLPSLISCCINGSKMPILHEKTSKQLIGGMQNKIDIYFMHNCFQSTAEQ